jgi:transcriptional regulator with XRE-family HTH domain
MRMQSHELLREVFQKCSAKQVAAELGLSLSMIYKWAEPQDVTAGSGAANPLDRIEALLRCSNDPRIVQWICQRAGGFFIKNPKTNNPHPEFLIPATNEIIQEFADLLAVIANAVADNQITQEEAADIRGRWEELKTVTEGFVQCCEQGNFRPLKDSPVSKPKGKSEPPPPKPNGHKHGRP